MTSTALEAGGPVFVLGTQRSGTTWLANIFDSHPELLFFYEPFARGCDVIEGFPDEFTFVAPPDEKLEHLLRDRIPALTRYRSRIYNPVTLTESQFRRESGLMKRLGRLHRRIRPKYARSYAMLQANRLGQSPVVYFAKEPGASRTVIKEVRLYFKIDLLAAAFPNARFVHVIRHPAAVVGSMLNYLGKGRLIELNAQIPFFIERVRTQTRFGHYGDDFTRLENGTLAQRLALFWRMSNEEMSKQFAAIPGRVHTVVYEDLAQNPQDVVRRMFDACEISMHSSTERYVAASSTKSSGRQTELDTTRESTTYYRRWRETTPPDVIEAVNSVCEGSPLTKIIDSYYG